MWPFQAARYAYNAWPSNIYLMDTVVHTALCAIVCVCACVCVCVCTCTMFPFTVSDMSLALHKMCEPPVGVCVRGNSYHSIYALTSLIVENQLQVLLVYLWSTAVMHGGDVQPAYTIERSRDSVYHRDWLHMIQHSQNTVSGVAFPESLLHNHIHILISMQSRVQTKQNLVEVTLLRNASRVV